MRIFLNKKPVNSPYGGGNSILSLFSKYCMDVEEHEIFFDLKENVDVSFIFDSRAACSLEPFDKIRKKSKILIQRINDNDKHRNGIGVKDKCQKDISNYADGIIYISNWIKDYFDLNKKCTVINNACDRSVFNCLEKDFEEKTRIITHHWSNNVNKGFDVYEKLINWSRDSGDVTFHILGNVPDKFPNFNVIKPCDYKKIPAVLRKADIYVSASRYEAGGCHVVEGMACGLYPLVSSLGGGTVDYVQGYGDTFENFEDLTNKIKQLILKRDLLKEKITNVKEKYTYSSQDMSREYLSFAKSML